MKLKELRNSLGITQKDLAHRIDVNQQTIARWENGKTEPSLQQLRDLAMIFQTSVDVILGRGKPISRYPKYFHLENDDTHSDYYYGEVGINLNDGDITKWYPISIKNVNLFGNIYVDNVKENDFIFFETLNNRQVAVSLKNITSVTLVEEAVDEPIGDWNFTFKEEKLPTEMYRAIDEFRMSPNDAKINMSKKLFSTVSDYIKENNLDKENNLAEFISYTYFYGKNGLLFKQGMNVEDDYLPGIFTSLEEPEYTGYIQANDWSGSNYIINKRELALVEAPLHQTKDGYKQLYPEIFDEK